MGECGAAPFVGAGDARGPRQATTDKVKQWGWAAELATFRRRFRLPIRGGSLTGSLQILGSGHNRYQRRAWRSHVQAWIPIGLTRKRHAGSQALRAPIL